MYVYAPLYTFITIFYLILKCNMVFSVLSISDYVRMFTQCSGSGTGKSLQEAGLFWSLLMMTSFLFQAADTVLKVVAILMIFYFPRFELLLNDNLWPFHTL